MAYQYSFADNSEYGAEDLNSLVSSLVSSGVADGFEDGTAYNASKLNDVISTVYSAGVVPSSVSTLRVTKTSDGVISIAPGLAFFADGSTIKITSAETLSYEAGSKNYVYLKQDLTAQNRNYPACTTTAPTGDFVLLAEISAQGEITDKRTYAKGKVPGYQSNANVCMVSAQSICDNGKDLDATSGTVEFSLDLGTNNYSRVFCIQTGKNSGFDSDGAYGSLGVYSLTDGSYFSIFMHTPYTQIARDKLIVGANNADLPCANITFSVSGSTLSGVLSWSAMGYGKANRTYNFTLVLC